MVNGSSGKVTNNTKYTIGGAGSIGSAASATPLSYYNISVTSNYTVNVYYDTLTADTFYRVEFTRWVADVDNPKDKYLPTLTINGVTVPRSSVTVYGCCAKKTYQYKALWGNIKNYMRDGANTVSVNFQGGSVQTHQILNMKETSICNKQYNEQFFCENNVSSSGSTLVSTTCTDKNDKVVDGITFSRSCWKQSEVYQKEGPPAYEEDAQCGVLRSAGCGLISLSLIHI